MAHQIQESSDLGAMSNNPIFVDSLMWKSPWHYVIASCVPETEAGTKKQLRSSNSFDSLTLWWQKNSGAIPSDKKLELIRKSVQHLLSQYPEYMEQLTATGKSRIELVSEDSFVGIGSDGNGMNYWGRTLEQLRGQTLQITSQETLSNPLGPGVKPPLDLQLVGERVTIRPLDLEKDLDDLYRATHDDRPELVWAWVYKGGPFSNTDDFKKWLKMYIAPEKVPLVVYDNKSGAKIGMYNLIAINEAHRCLEVGGIWFTPAFQRSFANLDTSLLVLSYCFEVIKYRRVEWKTHHMNTRSQRAALRLGFKFEGRFRNHLISHGNRDTMWYSMTDYDWPSAKKMLQKRVEGAPDTL